jgi:hypothetical protein
MSLLTSAATGRQTKGRTEVLPFALLNGGREISYPNFLAIPLMMAKAAVVPGLVLMWAGLRLMCKPFRISIQNTVA